MKTKILLIGITALTAISSCQKTPGTDDDGADRILVGIVIPMDKNDTVAQAVAFKDGKVLFVGSYGNAPALPEFISRICSIDNAYNDKFAKICLLVTTQVPLT